MKATKENKEKHLSPADLFENEEEKYCVIIGIAINIVYVTIEGAVSQRTLLKGTSSLRWKCLSCYSPLSNQVPNQKPVSGAILPQTHTSARSLLCAIHLLGHY